MDHFYHRLNGFFDYEEIYNHMNRVHGRIYANETPIDELELFIDGLTTEQFSKIQKFFETMPVMKKEIEYTCPVCGSNNYAVLNGISSFF